MYKGAQSAGVSTQTLSVGSPHVSSGQWSTHFLFPVKSPHRGLEHLVTQTWVFYP